MIQLSIAKPLSIIFKHCLNWTNFVDIWKITNICPIYKEIISRLLTTINLLHYCLLQISEKLLSEHQSGFDKMTLVQIGYSQLYTAFDYGCSFVAKLSWKKYIYILKKYVFYKIYIVCKKNVFIWKKSFILHFFLLKKTFFYREKYKWKCRNIYLIWEIYFYAENACVTNKLWIFLKYVFILQKKIFFDHKKYIC